jgi:hypothetical protein
MNFKIETETIKTKDGVKSTYEIEISKLAILLSFLLLALAIVH